MVILGQTVFDKKVSAFLINSVALEADDKELLEAAIIKGAIIKGPERKALAIKLGISDKVKSLMNLDEPKDDIHAELEKFEKL